MPTSDHVQRVRVYVSSGDRWEGEALYRAVLRRLQQAGATGATALQGLAGFGPGGRARTSMPKGEEQTPVVIEWVDRAERVARLLPLLDEMLPESLITVEELRIHRAMLRGSGRFGSDTSAGDLVQAEVQTVAHSAALDEVFAILLRGQQQLVPVVNAQQHMVGLVGPQELARRAGLRLAPHLLPLLTTEERASLLLPLASRPVAEVMTADWRGTTSATPVLQALMMMVEWNYDQLPVTSRDGRLAGLLSQQAVLQAALAASASTANVRNADQPAPVQLVMQSQVPTVRHDQSLGSALAQLLAAPGHYMLVVDAASRVVGEISLAGALRQLSGAARTALLAALQAERPDPGPFPGGDEPLDALLERDMVTVAPQDSINDATRRLAESGRMVAPVIDDGRICGVVARGGLLRAFIQESE